MFGDITFGQYFPGKSFLHRLDPRGKILLTLLLISLVFLLTDFAPYVILLAFVVLAAVSARLGARQMLRSVRPLRALLIITFIVHAFSLVVPQGHYVLCSWQGISITREGLQAGLLMSARLVFLVLLSAIITMTTSPLALTDGIEMLLRPFRRIGLPAHELAMMMTIALRFIPTLLNETDRIMKAQTARGMDFAGGNIFRRGRNLLPILIPLFLSAFRRAEELAVAMEARCYRGGEGRTRMNELRFTMDDFWAALAVATLAAAMFLAQGGVGLCAG